MIFKIFAWRLENMKVFRQIIVHSCKNIPVILRLNDRYAVDGNDPNGFVGVMWSITGIHDQVEIIRNHNALIVKVFYILVEILSLGSGSMERIC